MTALAQSPWMCDVCDNERAVRAAKVPGLSTTVAYGERCLAANVHPYGVLVAKTADMGGLINTSHWWRDMVERTCQYLRVSIDQFNEDVARVHESQSGD
ncbi:hypothetical protein ACWEVP_31630 [Amycolatopsis sp. NPDC003865]